VDTCFVTRWWGGGLMWTVHATLSLERWSFRWRQFDCSFVFFSRKNVSNRPSFFSAPFSIRYLAISMNSLKRTVRAVTQLFLYFFRFDCLYTCDSFFSGAERMKIIKIDEHLRKFSNTFRSLRPFIGVFCNQSFAFNSQ
jgi:hypothetical protein